MIVKKTEYVKNVVSLESTKLTDEQKKMLDIIKKYVTSLEIKIENKKM